MSQNKALAHGKLYRCQTQQSDMQITAEIMQTYDLLKFAIARSTGINFSLCNTIRSALQKQEWSDKKGWETEKQTGNV